MILNTILKKLTVIEKGILDLMKRRFEDGVGAQKLETMLTQMAAVEELCARIAAAGR
jgi:hypothetical protein